MRSPSSGRPRRAQLRSSTLGRRRSRGRPGLEPRRPLRRLRARLCRLRDARPGGGAARRNDGRGLRSVASYGSAGARPRRDPGRARPARRRCRAGGRSLVGDWNDWWEPRAERQRCALSPRARSQARRRRLARLDRVRERDLRVARPPGLRFPSLARRARARRPPRRRRPHARRPLPAGHPRSSRGLTFLRGRHGAVSLLGGRNRGRCGPARAASHSHGRELGGSSSSPSPVVLRGCS